MPENLKKEFIETWLKKKIKLRENTIRMYSRFFKELPDLDFVTMSEEEIRGAVNLTLLRFPNNVAKSAFVNYIEFLFSKTSATDPIFFERMRTKKNNIIANIELPKGKNAEYAIDFDKYYIEKIKLLNAIKKTDISIRKIILLNYDGGFRINELLKNDWENIESRGIFIPRKISKTNRDRYVEWLMPESAKIVESLKSKGIFQNSLKLNYYKVWKALTYKKIGDASFNPHSLRHTRLTDLAWDGWELGLLSMRAGHSNPKITSQYLSWTATRKGRITTLEKYVKKNGIILMDFLEEKSES